MNMHTRRFSRAARAIARAEPPAPRFRTLELRELVRVTEALALTEQYLQMYLDEAREAKPYHVRRRAELAAERCVARLAELRVERRRLL